MKMFNLISCFPGWSGGWSSSRYCGWRWPGQKTILCDEIEIGKKKQVGLEAFINLAKSSKLLDLTTPSFRNVERWKKCFWYLCTHTHTHMSPLPYEKLWQENKLGKPDIVHMRYLCELFFEILVKRFLRESSSSIDCDQPRHHVF